MASLLDRFGDAEGRRDGQRLFPRLVPVLRGGKGGIFHLAGLSWSIGMHPTDNSVGICASLQALHQPVPDREPDTD